jgi:ribonuclease HII
VNKGYPTLDHRKAIAAHGPCAHHRLTFRLLAEEPVLF